MPQSIVDCPACGGSGKRKYTTAELETLAALSSDWASTRDIAERMPGIEMRALANRLAALERIGAAVRRPISGGRRNGPHQSEWRRAEETKRRAA